MKLEPATDAVQTIARYRAHVSEGMAMLAELMEAHVEVRSEGREVGLERELDAAVAASVGGSDVLRCTNVRAPEAH